MSRRIDARFALALAAALALGLPGVASAALPTVKVAAVTTVMPDLGVHRGIAVTAKCAATARLVGGGSYLRTVADPAAPGAILPTNGLTLGGSAPSKGVAPVDLVAPDGTLDVGSWLSIANFTGVSEAGDQASTFALCATVGGPSHTVVRTASTVGINATQQVSPPNLTIATCPAGTRLVGGGAATNTPDQVNDGTTFGNAGNLKPLGDYPSDAAGIAAADGSTTATSWSAYGSAGITSAGDTVTAFAVCSSDPASAPVKVARVDVVGPDAQIGTTVTTASATCPSGTRMLGGGYSVDETVTGVGSGLQPQQGYHLRGSYPSAATGAPPVASANNASNVSTWTALVQAGGQTLPVGDHMTSRSFALCATAPVLAFTSTPPVPALYGGTYVPSAGGGNGTAVTFTVAPATACTLAADGVTVGFSGVGTCTITAKQAVGGLTAKQTVAIKQAPLTVTAPTLTKALGAPVPPLNPTYTGLVNGDSAPATAPVCTTTATATSPKGVYPTTCTGAADAHYKITSKPGKLTVR